MHLKGAARVDHPAAHRFAHAAFHLQRFAGQDRFVQHRDRTGDAPVDGHHFARADHQQVVDRHVLQRDDVHRRPDAAAGEPRRVFQQRPQIVGRAALGRRLQRPPPASITAINAPARYSPTSSVPTSDSTAIRSTPNRPRRSAASTHTTAGTTATTVPAIQQPSATRGAPASQAIPPAANATTVTPARTSSTH